VPRRPGSSRYHVLPAIGQTLCTTAGLDDDGDTCLHTVSDGHVRQYTVDKASVVRGTDVASVRCYGSQQKHVEVEPQGSLVESETATVNRLQSSIVSSSVVDQVTT